MKTYKNVFLGVVSMFFLCVLMQSVMTHITPANQLDIFRIFAPLIVVIGPLVLEIWWLIYPSQVLTNRKRKKRIKLVEKTNNVSLDKWKTSAPIPIWIIIPSIVYILVCTKCEMEAVIAPFILYALYMIVFWLDIVWFEEHFYYKKLSEKVKNVVRDNITDDYYPIKYGIIRVDDTKKVPGTFSKGDNRPDKMLVFDWKSEVEPYVKSRENWQQEGIEIKIIMNSSFNIYVFDSKEYSIEELIETCKLALTHEHYQISKYSYIYVVGDEKKLDSLLEQIEKWDWLQEVDIRIVKDASDINVVDIVDEYSKKQVYRSLMTALDEEDVEYNWEFKAIYHEIMQAPGFRLLPNKFTKETICFDRFFCRPFWRFFAKQVSNADKSDTETKELVNNTINELVDFECVDQMVYALDTLGEEFDTSNLSKANLLLTYVNRYASKFYRFIPYQEETYYFNTNNYYLCGFFQNMFRFDERSTAILAGFDYADLVLRFVMVYYLRKSNVAPEDFYNANMNKYGRVSLNLQQMGTIISKYAALDENGPLQKTVIDTYITSNGLLENAVDFIRNMFGWEITSDNMDFSSLVYMLRLMRNALRGHGAITKDNEEIMWFSCYVFFVILGDMLKVYDFNIDIENGMVYAYYTDDEYRYYLGEYVKYVSGMPCPIYEVDKKKNGELVERYMNYWRGDLWTPQVEEFYSNV